MTKHDRTAERSPVAAFDFDGTITKGDSLLPFIVQACGPLRVALVGIRHSPAIFRAATGLGSRDTAKEAFAGDLLRGRAIDELQALGATFGRRYLQQRLHPAIGERIAWHKQQGHELVIVSASMTIYLAAVAEELGFDTLLSTQLEVVDGLVTGRFLGNNVRGAEKARLLTEHLGGDSRPELYAYGNSSGDHAMLAMADHPFWVKKQRFTPWTHG